MNDKIEAPKPIIIKRIKKGGHDFHGGSWKVAFADFATAMMAFFLLLWLMGNTNEAEKQAISGYFNDPSGVADKSGATTSIIGEGGADSAVIQIEVPEVKLSNEVDEDDVKLNEQKILDLAEQREMQQLELLKSDLEKLVATSDAFTDFKEQVFIDITPTGLRIQIVDKDKRPMFDSASAELKFHSKEILRGLAEVLAQVPNKLSITGHTDATPFTEREDYGNWELSADRANAARRVLNSSGISEQKITRVEGFSSSILFDKKRPYAPINRRIAIIVLKQSAADEIEKQVTQ
jgi:chemotaxis protein MotB